MPYPMWFKKIIKYALKTFMVLFVLLITIYAFLHLPYIQNKVGQLLIQQFAGLTQNKLHIAKVAFRPFDEISLEDIYIEDLRGDTLFYAQQLSVQLSVLHLLQQEIKINGVQLAHFYVHVHRDSVAAPFNFQFLIPKNDPNSVPSKAIPIYIDQLSLTDGKLFYDVWSEEKKDQIFDANHIKITNIDLLAQIAMPQTKQWNVQLNNLSFKEQTGLDVVQIESQLNGMDQLYTFNNLHIKFPDSHIQIPSIKVNLLNIDQFDYEIILEKSELCLSDFQFVNSKLKTFRDTIELSGLIKGRFPELNIPELKMSYGKGFDLEAEIIVSDILDYTNSNFQLNLTHLTVNKACIDLLKDQEIELKQLNQLVFPYKLQAKVHGPLAHLQIEAQLQSPELTCLLAAQLHNKLNPLECNFTVAIKQLDTYLAHTWVHKDIGKIRLSADITGQIDTKGIKWTNAYSQIQNLRANGYNYSKICVAMQYAPSKAKLTLLSKDPYLPAYLEVNSDLQAQTNFKVQLQQADLYKLGFSKTDSSKLTTTFSGALTGVNVEQLVFKLNVDSLELRTPQDKVVMRKFGLNYTAQANSFKNLKIYSNLLNGELEGNFTVAYLPAAINNFMAVHYPNLMRTKYIPRGQDHQLNFKFETKNLETLTRLLDLPIIIQSPVTFKGSFDSKKQDLSLTLDCPKMLYKSYNIADFNVDICSKNNDLELYSKVKMLQDSSLFEFGFNGISKGPIFESTFNFTGLGKNYHLDGSLACVTQFKNRSSQNPNLSIKILPTDIKLNKNTFKLLEATIGLENKVVTIENVGLLFSANEFVKIQGIISDQENDRLDLHFSHIQLNTLADLFQVKTPITGEINGELRCSQLLTTPNFASSGLEIADITLENKTIGTLKQSIFWRDTDKAIIIDGKLDRGDLTSSSLYGTYYKLKDSLHLDLALNEIELAWFKSLAGDQVFNLGGIASTRLKIMGKLASPQITGYSSFEKAQMALRANNVLYNTSDTLFFEPNKIVFRDFKLMDENNKNAIISGGIIYPNFTNISANLDIQFKDFLLLNNLNQTDGLYYGYLTASGKSQLKGSEKEMKVNVQVTNGINSKVFVRMPDNPNAAAEYKSIVFTKIKDTIQKSEPLTNFEKMRLPLKISMEINLNPNLLMGMEINPETKDMASVSGSGLINMDYDMQTSKALILGRYTIETGDCAVSLKNITRKNFKVQPGGFVVFKGDPMASEFDITAAYMVKADLVGLDPSFGTDTRLSSTRVNVNSLINASGSANKLTLKYDIKLTDVDDETQKKVDALIPTQDIKIKEIAYLLAVGSFYSPVPSESSGAGSNLWTSLASSSLTNQLNDILGNVLKDNWSIGTDFYTEDNSSKVKLDVNISTRLLNNRLVLTSNIGYKGNSDDSNLSGDFEAQYKLNYDGNWLLRMYNLANEQYYSQAKTVTGAGLIYRREAKQFKYLFKRKPKKNQSQ